VAARQVVEVEPGAAGSAHRPLLASTGSALVVLAASDGALQLWDAASCAPRGLLGAHATYITSLAASGPLVASTCAAEVRLWDAQRRVCLFQVPVGLPLPSPGAACACACTCTCTCTDARACARACARAACVCTVDGGREVGAWRAVRSQGQEL
jgi:hypothetical protein